MQSMRLRFQKGDLLAIALTLLLAALVFALFLPGRTQKGTVAEIYLDGKLLQTVSLNVEQEIPVTGDYRNLISVRSGKIAVTESDCPGEDCVHMGWVDGSGMSIVCLPNKLEIRIISDTADVDFVVG